jgi:SAM-dependent methyltransferase
MPPEDPADRFASTENYYAAHRPGYGDEAIEYLAEQYELGQSSRALDLGCGAGQIAVPLAEHAGEVVGMDPNEAMLDHARDRAADAGRENIDWRVGSDADLPAVAPDLAPLDLTTMGRSFHWMNQARTLDALREYTAPGGGVALLNDPEWLRRGTADWQAAVYEMVCEFLADPPERTGPVSHDDPWDEKLAAHGFREVETREFDLRRDWTVEGALGYVFSLSYCSPETFGDEQAAFADRVRERLAAFEEPLVQAATVSVIAGRVRAGL